MNDSNDAARRTPVVIGVGQFLDRDGAELEPAALMTAATRLAIADSETTIPAQRIDVIAAVPTFSWRYNDPGRIVADSIGADRAATWYATVGGNTPQALMNRLAQRIQEGEVELGVICGAEAGHSRQAIKRRGETAPWTTQDESVAPDWHDDGEFVLADPAELEVGVAMPTQAYPLFESALWHQSGRSRAEHLHHIGALWAGLSEVAAENPHAWQRESYSADEIVEVTPENRYIGSPYTKHMVANPTVNMAAAVVVCSDQLADELGVPADRRVYLLAGTDGTDAKMSRRVDFVSSPAMRIAGRRAMELAEVTAEDLGHVDLYSCFPSAVQLATKELGIDDTRPLTVYGGLPFAGGPWNNPVTHAIASMVEVLRADPGSVGLVTANGGHVDKHAFGLYSTTAPEHGFRYERPQSEIDAAGSVEVAAQFEGPATIEAWTVMHSRDGVPERAHAACRNDAGERLWAVTDDPEMMSTLVVDDVAGAAVVVDDHHVMRFA